VSSNDVKGAIDAKYPQPNDSGILKAASTGQGAIAQLFAPGGGFDQFVRVKTRGAVGAAQLNPHDKRTAWNAFTRLQGNTHNNADGTVKLKDGTIVPAILKEVSFETASGSTSTAKATLPGGNQPSKEKETSAGGPLGVFETLLKQRAKASAGAAQSAKSGATSLPTRLTHLATGTGETDKNKRKKWSIDDELAERSSRVSIMDGSSDRLSSTGRGVAGPLADDDVASDPGDNDFDDDTDADSIEESDGADLPDPDVVDLRERVDAVGASLDVLHTAFAGAMREAIGLLRSLENRVSRLEASIASKTGASSATQVSSPGLNA